MKDKLTFQQQCSLIANGEDLPTNEEMSICVNCIHAYVCEEYNLNRVALRKGCAYHNDHFLDINDNVVLSRKEYDELVESKRQLGCYIEDQKILLQRINSPDPFWFCAFGGCEGACKECKDTCEMSIFVKERKEMAKKIYLQAKAIVDSTKWAVQGREYLHIDALKELVKQLGAEIETDDNCKYYDKVNMRCNGAKCTPECHCNGHKSECTEYPETRKQFDSEIKEN